MAGGPTLIGDRTLIQHLTTSIYSQSEERQWYNMVPRGWERGLECRSWSQTFIDLPQSEATKLNRLPNTLQVLNDHWDERMLSFKRSHTIAKKSIELF